MSLTIPEVINFILRNVERLNVVKVPVESAYGYVVAKDIVVRKPVPQHNISLVDGYAVSTANIGKEGRVSKCVGQARPDCVFRVRTGGYVPNIYDEVVPIEYVKDLGDSIIITRDLKGKYTNILPRGSDLGEGEVILKRGEYLRSSHVRVLGELGVDYVYVYRKPRVALIPVGDEFIHTGVREYTSHAILAMLKSHGDYIATRLKPLPDDEVVIRDELRRLITSRRYDVIVTIGGSSVGAKDRTWLSILELGSVKDYFRGLRVIPGKTTSAAVMSNGVSVISLPGPLNSAIAGLIYVVLPMLRRLEGSDNVLADRVCCKARVSRNIDLSMFRDVCKLLYARLEISGNGNLAVTPFEPYPPKFSILLKANSFILLGEGIDKVLKGELINVRCVKGVLECFISN